MKRRQRSAPRQWLIADERLGEDLWAIARRLPRQSGIVVLHRTMPLGERARLLSRLRRLGRDRGLAIVDEAAGEAVRVHNLPELRAALLQRIPIVLLSPLKSTRTHPDWPPIPRMRAAALARLGRGRLLALGGMDESGFRRIAPLGFQGWAGIDAWRGPQVQETHRIRREKPRPKTRSRART